MDQLGAEDPAHCDCVRSLQRFELLHTVDRVRRRVRQCVQPIETCQLWAALRVNPQTTDPHGLPVYHIDLACLFVCAYEQLDARDVRPDSSAIGPDQFSFQNYKLQALAHLRQDLPHSEAVSLVGMP